MPAIEYSRGTADNIFTRFRIMAFLYDDLKVRHVPINLIFFFYGHEWRTMDGRMGLETNPV